MIIELPPHIEQQLIKTANDKGKTVAQLVTDMLINTQNTNGFDFLEQDGIYSHGRHALSSEHLQAIYDDLDSPPSPTPAMQELMAKYGGLNV